MKAYIVCKMKTSGYEWIEVRIPCELPDKYYSMVKDGKVIITMVDNPTIEIAD